MRWKSLGLLAVILIAVFPSLAAQESASADSTNCGSTVPQDGVLTPLGYWLYFPKDPSTFYPDRAGLWREDNGISGLQSEPCVDLGVYLYGSDFHEVKVQTGPLPPPPEVEDPPSIEPLPVDPWPILDAATAESPGSCVSNPPNEGRPLPGDPNVYAYAPVEHPLAFSQEKVGVWIESNAITGLQTDACMDHGVFRYGADTPYATVGQEPPAPPAPPTIPENPPAPDPEDPPTAPTLGGETDCAISPDAEGLPSPTGPRHYAYLPLSKPSDFSPGKVGFWREANSVPGLQTEACVSQGVYRYGADERGTPCVDEPVIDCVPGVPVPVIPRGTPCGGRALCQLQYLNLHNPVRLIEHGDDWSGGLAVPEDPIPADVNTVPVMRARVDGGSPVLAYLAVNDYNAQQVLDASKLPTVMLSAASTNDSAIAVPLEYAILRLNEVRTPQSVTASHSEPEPAEALAIAVYPDRYYQETSYWRGDIRYAVEKAAAILAGLDIDLAYTIYTHILDDDVQDYDVKDECNLQETADHEASFSWAAPLVAVFSRGDKISGYYGKAINGPITAQIRGEGPGTTWWDYCQGGWGPQLRLPAIYQHDDWYVPKYALATLFTHELAHQFTMKHKFGECWSDWRHEHRTIETATSDRVYDPVPAHCGDPVDGDYHPVFSQTTRWSMTNETNDWYDCSTKVVTC